MIIVRENYEHYTLYSNIFRYITLIKINYEEIKGFNTRKQKIV